MNRTLLQPLIALLLVLCGAMPAAAGVVLAEAELFVAQETDSAPASFEQMHSWIQERDEIERMPLSGGRFWMVAPFMVNESRSEWVVNLHNSIAERVDYLVLGSDGSRQMSSGGYDAPYDYLFDYGKNVTLRYGVEYWLVARVESRYFSSIPKLEINGVSEHRLLTDRIAAAVLVCLGGLLFIAVYNLLIYSSTRDRAFLYYGLYVITYLLGWAFTFHVPAQLFGFHQLELHHLFFIGLPIFNILFYKHFLQLPTMSPPLWRASQILLWLCVLALPTSFLLLSHTAIIASVLIGLWIVLAIIAGNVCLIKGFAPARYFIMAFSCLLLPALLILPGNLGLTTDVFEFTELTTLIGGSADALLLSLALASKLKLLSEERDAHAQQLIDAWEKARLDSLTQISNRFAFDEFMQSQQQFAEAVTRQSALLLLDVDGLKHINDTLGHQAGDELLKTLVEWIRGVELGVSGPVQLYRIGGDEFALVVEAAALESVLDKLAQAGQYLSEQGFAAGLSVGYALNSQVQAAHDWLRAADSRMYRNKASRRHELESHTVTI
ncbi:GGDEF domain-containing protein [Shewanella jiangmenensis]|nr:diguanylate cyclase [Shewanella jiangmenensis]